LKLVIIAAGLLMAMPTIAFAKDNCADPQDQATMNECAGASLKASDRTLNELFGQIEARLKDDAGTRKLLVQAQRDWIRFRDAECAFETASAGSTAPMLAAMCANRLTQARAKEFEGFLNCPEGDTACPVPPAN